MKKSVKEFKTAYVEFMMRWESSMHYLGGKTTILQTNVDVERQDNKIKKS